MIIIFGASGGIGFQLLKHFKAIGLDCIGTYNSNPMPNENGMVKVDITNLLEVIDFVESLKFYGKLLVVNCTGMTDACAMHKADYESWKSVIDVNILGAFNIARSVLPLMRKNRFGRIINFGSIVSKKPVFGSSAYIVSKTALAGLSSSINFENAKFGISAVTINLGYTDVGMIESVQSDMKSDIISRSPFGRLCSISEVISTVEYAFECEYVGGSQIDLFGGI